MSGELTGRIVKGIGSFYSVAADSSIYICRPRGKFRLKDETPMVGDMVKFTPPGVTQEGYLLEILPRKNKMLRPPVSNIDLIFIVVASTDPEPDLTLVDKMLINAGMMGTESVICINKSDLASIEQAQKIAGQYKGFKTLIVSAYKSEGMEQIEEMAFGKTVCFAGQSGTGKTSLLNNILPGRDMEVGEISQKTKRGKHTTRHAELVPFAGGYLVDTPGFSLLELPVMEPGELQKYYEDFRKHEGFCRYKTCRHSSEPGCAVKEAVDCGEISKQRHARYCDILKEMEDKWRNRYG